MRRLIFICVLLSMSFPLLMKGETIREFDFHYDLNEFIIKEKGDMVSVIFVPTADRFPNLDYGIPSIPEFVYEIVKGNFNKNDDVRLDVTHTEKKILKENIDVATLFPLDENGGLIVDEWVKYDKFGDSIQSNVRADIDHGVVCLWVSPFEYDVKTRTLYFMQDIHVTLRIIRKETTEIAWGYAYLSRRKSFRR